jgi:Flp pilus assembly protein TadG
VIAHRRARAADRPLTLREKGAALVEFAFIVPLLALLAFGTLEVGYQWRFAHEAVGSSRAGARVGAGLGDDPTTDFYILSSIRASLESAGMLGKLQRVIVYQATTQGSPPSTCLAATPTGACNVYNASMITSSLQVTSFHATSGCYTGTAADAPLKGWCPSSRITNQPTADYVGVRLVLNSAAMTGMYPAYTITRESVMRMEP